MRRRRKNPGGLLVLLIGGGVAVAGAAAYLLLRKPALRTSSDGTQFATDPAFTGGLPSAEGLLVGDCIVAVQGQAGFMLPGSVPAGENTILRVVSSGGRGSSTVRAVSTDPRVTTQEEVTVPTRAISGGGECGAL